MRKGQPISLLLQSIVLKVLSSAIKLWKEIGAKIQERHKSNNVNFRHRGCMHNKA